MRWRQSRSRHSAGQRKKQLRCFLSIFVGLFCVSLLSKPVSSGLQKRPFLSATTLLSTESDSATQPQFTIVVLTKNRLGCLTNLLSSLQNTHFDGDTIRLQIRIDHSDAQDDLLAAAKTFSFLHGSKEVVLSHRELGLAKSWFRAWNPGNDAERAIIFEDDITLSPLWYRWLKRAWLQYGDRADIAGISLQRQSLVPQQPHHNNLKVASNKPFLYKLVGSIGFSPNPVYWRLFLRWVESINLDSFDVSTPDLVSSVWWNQLDKRHMWTQHFIFFSLTMDIYTLYVNLPNEETLAAHMRAKGAHFETDEGADFHTAKNISMNFPQHLTKYDWNGKELSQDMTSLDRNVKSTLVYNARRIQAENGFTYIMFLNAAFLNMTKSWVCEVRRTAEKVLQSTLFISSDFETTRKLFAFEPSLLIFTMPSNLKQAVSFGSYSYYSVVLERLKLQNTLLQEGIHIHIIESDQFWSEDVTPSLRKKFEQFDLIAGQEGPFPQSNETVSRICGGFHGLLSTEDTRSFFADYLDRYAHTLEVRINERESKQLRDHEDDQAALTRMALGKSLSIGYVDRCDYANGLWFDNANYRRRCPNPKVLHNGYIVGNRAKTERAQQTGRWYLSGDGLQCQM